MREKEIQLFTDAMQQAGLEFYLDSIKILEQLIEEFPDSELVDDALYDIGLCYFNMNQFEKAIEYFEKVINEYPDATITVLTGGNEYGLTAAKCHYAILNCYLGQGKLNEAQQKLTELDSYNDTYIKDTTGKKTTFKHLGERAIEVFLKNK